MHSSSHEGVSRWYLDRLGNESRVEKKSQIVHRLSRGRTHPTCSSLPASSLQPPRNRIGSLLDASDLVIETAHEVNLCTLSVTFLGCFLTSSMFIRSVITHWLSLTRTKTPSLSPIHLTLKSFSIPVAMWSVVYYIHMPKQSSRALPADPYGQLYLDILQTNLDPSGVC
ncbi:hypothetical protein GGR54DRAFT_490815 [Hypoxylon sp. NC1633]|nr:hypothetical protein GGR54DRAFT_490815 [Hypoxylon sp. NC1633]